MSPDLNRTNHSPTHPTPLSLLSLLTQTMAVTQWSVLLFWLSLGTGLSGSAIAGIAAGIPCGILALLIFSGLLYLGIFYCKDKTGNTPPAAAAATSSSSSVSSSTYGI